MIKMWVQRWTMKCNRTENPLQATPFWSRRQSSVPDHGSSEVNANRKQHGAPQHTELSNQSGLAEGHCKAKAARMAYLQLTITRLKQPRWLLGHKPRTQEGWVQYLL